MKENGESDHGLEKDEKKKRISYMQGEKHNESSNNNDDF